MTIAKDNNGYLGAVMAMSSFIIMMLGPCVVSGHGRLVDPPSRSSMWRYGFVNPHNYNDNQLFCGGVQVQYNQNGGKCGVCGDPWQGPRDNEPGGKFARGIIVRKYQEGQIIEVTVELTANHKGYFQFSLCPNNFPFKNVTNECMEKHILKVVATGERRFMVPAKGSHRLIKLKLKLPEGLRCSACVFRWKYNAGNSWGTNSNGVGCKGCGNQEQFYGCADVAVGYEEIKVGIAPPRHPWYFEPPDSNWHWGIVSNGTFIGGAQALHGGHSMFFILPIILCSLFSFTF